MLVHQRLKDKTGMAGMADGDNRYYGCQNKFAGKIHRYNGWHQCSILSIFPLCRYNGYWNHSDFIQDCYLTDNTVLFLLDLWSLTVHGALWMLELNVRPNSCTSSMNSFVRFVVSHCLVFQSAHSSFVSFTFLCHAVQSYLYFVYIHFEKACCSPKKICVCLFPVFTLLGNPLHMDLRNAYMYSFSHHLTV